MEYYGEVESYKVPTGAYVSTVSIDWLSMSPYAPFMGIDVKTGEPITQATPEFAATYLSQYVGGDLHLLKKGGVYVASSEPFIFPEGQPSSVQVEAPVIPTDTRAYAITTEEGGGIVEILEAGPGIPTRQIESLPSDAGGGNGEGPAGGEEGLGILLLIAAAAMGMG